MKQPPSALPERLQVGACSYRIIWAEKLDDDRDVMGRCDYHSGEITVKDGVAPDAEFVTIWHEVLHAILHNAGWDKTHPEALIEAVSHGIAQALRENPYLRGPW